MDKKILSNASSKTLEQLPRKTFLCTQMSAVFYAILKDDYGIEAKIMTGNLSYKNQIIFKQDFSISEAPHDTLREWSGHAWVETDGLICDLSIFRTLYSEQFELSCKNELINLFGTGRGILIAPQEEMQSQFSLSYTAIDTLDDDMATSIIKGLEKLEI